MKQWHALYVSPYSYASLKQPIIIITVMSYGCHGIPTHQQCNCLFNSLFRLKTKEIFKLRSIGPLWGESTSDCWFTWQRASNANVTIVPLYLIDCYKISARPTLERQKTLGHLRSINRHMIIHFANQSQTCQLLKILKTNFFFKNISWKETVKSSAINPRSNWYRKSISIIKSVKYMSSSWHNILTISPSVYRKLSGGR